MTLVILIIIPRLPHLPNYLPFPTGLTTTPIRKRSILKSMSALTGLHFEAVYEMALVVNIIMTPMSTRFFRASLIWFKGLPFLGDHKEQQLPPTLIPTTSLVQEAGVYLLDNRISIEQHSHLDHLAGPPRSPSYPALYLYHQVEAPMEM